MTPARPVRVSSGSSVGTVSAVEVVRDEKGEKDDSV